MVKVQGWAIELREDVVLEAHRRRLHPAQPAGGGEQRGGQLAEERVGVGDLPQGLGVVPGVDDRHRARRLSDALQPLVLDRGMNDQLHGPALYSIGLEPRRMTLARFPDNKHLQRNLKYLKQQRDK